MYLVKIFENTIVMKKIENTRSCKKKICGAQVNKLLLESFEVTNIFVRKIRRKNFEKNGAFRVKIISDPIPQIPVCLIITITAYS